jgi:hypothetical protein
MEQYKTELELLQFSVEKLKIAYNNFVKFDKAEDDRIRNADPDTFYYFVTLSFEQFMKSIADDKHFFTGESGFIEKHLIPHLPKPKGDMNEQTNL